MSERTCSICDQPKVLLFVAAEAGVVVSGTIYDDHEGHRIQAGDVVCIAHIATRPDGRYVRLEDGG